MLHFTRPATIAELAAAAAADHHASTGSNAELLHYLHRAENHWKAGNALAAAALDTIVPAEGNANIGVDLECAFMEYTIAATLILEDIPNHWDYNDALNAQQRQSLSRVSPLIRAYNER